MSERFQRLFSLTPDLYSKGCPIIIEAGALQKDTDNGNILAQLKMRNIDEKEITSCKVSLKAYENNGDEVEGVSDFSYLDLAASRGDVFGTKVPVILPNRTARSFTVDINEIVFSDGTVQRLDHNQWNPLPQKRSINEVLKDDELIKQYKIEVGSSADYYPEKKDGLFYCTCGTVNHESAKKCYKCGKSYETLLSCLDELYLRSKIDEKNKQAAIEHEKKQKKINMITKAVAVIVILAVIAGIGKAIYKPKEEKLYASLANKNYVAVDGWEEGRSLTFNDDGTVSDSDSEDIYVYSVQEIGDDEYAIDVALSEDSLFYNGEYEYIVTDVNGTQITGFLSSYSLEGSGRFELENTEKTEAFDSDNVNYDIKNSLCEHTFESTDKEGICYRFDDSYGYGGLVDPDHPNVRQTFRYEIRKMKNGKYVYDMAFLNHQKALFPNGEYGFEVTGIDGDQITELTHVESGTKYTLVE